MADTSLTAKQAYDKMMEINVVKPIIGKRKSRGN